MIENILIFILFLGPLIFIHELGHFLFARFFGVRVEVFSIGFGPKLIRKKIGDTEYALSLIPLGGYVKMFGDDPFKKDEISKEEQGYSFNHKSKLARFWIVFGGPLANFIMAFVLFFVLNLFGQKIPELKLGVVEKNSTLFNYGFRSSDILLKVNNRSIDNPGDILTDDKIYSSLVHRINEEVKVTFNSKSIDFLKLFMKTPPILRKPIVVNLKGEKFVVSAEKNKIDWKISLEEIYNINLPKIYLNKVSKDLKSVDSSIELSKKNNENYLDVLRKNNYFGLDLQVKSISMGSAAEKAGIKAGDVIISLNNVQVNNFEQLKRTLQNTKGPSTKIKIFTNGVLKQLSVTPKISKNETKDVKNKPVKLIGVYSNAEFIEPKLVNTKPKSIPVSIKLAALKTKDSIYMTFDFFIKLITAKISAKSIGGPLSIGKVAAASFKTSFSYFLQLMGLISINLGVINLFPVPVLDGGHIMFLIVELFNRNPLSRRKMEIAQQFGLSLLLMLMGWSLINDFTRLFN